MKQYDKIMVLVPISEYEKKWEDSDYIPVIGKNGIVCNILPFERNVFSDRGNMALKEQKDIIVLNIEELRECFLLGGMSSFADSKTPIKSFKDFLESKGIQP